MRKRTDPQARVLEVIDAAHDAHIRRETLEEATNYLQTDGLLQPYGRYWYERIAAELRRLAEDK